jgi:glutamate/tyrosine decarboxylase-like PLP-dependent enzyme
MFDLVTAASSIHGAYWLEGAGGIFAENRAMEWLVSLTGLPEGAFGVFTCGGTTANLSGIVAARETWRDKDPKHNNHKGIIIASRTAHASVQSMAKVIDADILYVETYDAMNGVEVNTLYKQLNPDQRERVFAVVATGGTTNAGIIDDLSSIADFCEQHNLWLHIDAAYGGGALATRTARHLFNGIERADSITIDPHKWFFAPYDCGAIIYKNPELAKKAHAQDGSYLDIFKEKGASGFNPSDYQIQLTRRVRGLPLWFSLAMHGTNRYQSSIETGLELAQIAAEKIKANEKLELVREPGLSVVLFRRKGWSARDYQEWTFKNLEDGVALVTPTKWKNGAEYETVIRFCFISPHTTENDIDIILNTL